MTIELVVFYILIAVVLCSAVILVTMRDVARALFLFFVVLLGLAGLYVFALADFVALTQLLVYVGGVLVLMLFAFMLSNKTVLTALEQGKMAGFFAVPAWRAGIIAVLCSGVLVYIALQMGKWEPAWIAEAQANQAVITPTDHNAERIGIHVMTHYLLPFEVVSVLLMMALIGATHLTRKEDEV